MSAQVQHQPPTWNRPTPLPPPVPLPPVGTCLPSQLGAATYLSSPAPSATLSTKVPPPLPPAVWVPQPIAPVAAPAPLVPLQSPCLAPPPSLGMSLDEYRQRLQWIYSVHKPDNVPKVDYLLQKYAGQEDYLYRSVCQKYGIDESMPLSMMVPQSAPLKEASIVGSCPKSLSIPRPPHPLDASASASWNIQPHQGGLSLPTLQPPPPPPPLLSSPPPHLAAALGSGPFCKQNAAPCGLAPASQIQLASSQRPQAEAPQPRKMQQVVEWDPATGKYIPSVAELDAELEALLGIGVAASPPPPSEPPLARLDPPAATPMLVDSVQQPVVQTAMPTASTPMAAGVTIADPPTLSTSASAKEKPDGSVAPLVDMVRTDTDEAMDPPLMDSLEQLPYASLLDAIDEIDSELLGEPSGFFRPVAAAKDDSSSSASSESEDSDASSSSAQPSAPAVVAQGSAQSSQQPLVADPMAAETQAVASLWDALRGVGSDDEEEGNRPPTMSPATNGMSAIPSAVSKPPTSNAQGPLEGSQDPYEALRQAMADGSDSDGNGEEV